MPQPQRPIRGTDNGYVLNLTDDERDLLRQLMGELESLLQEDGHPYLSRLFPVAYPDDDEAEAEYQRLMREELVTSRSANIEIVRELLDRSAGEPMTEGETLRWMQSLNAIRVVLGTMLGIDDDETAEQIDLSEGSGQQLYGYLSYLLEWTVQTLSGR
jgi:hypothetical protein